MKQDFEIKIIAKADYNVKIISSDNINGWEEFHEIGKRLAIQHDNSEEWESVLIILKEIVKAANRRTAQMKKEKSNVKVKPREKPA